jgi:hypothetical protein
MKLPRFGLGLIVAASLVSCSLARAADTRVYELRTYTTPPGKLEPLLARFRDHTMRIFERHGMTNVGYFLPMEEKDGKGQKLVYLLSYPSREAAKASWKAFNADPEWQEVQKKSSANGKLVEKVDSLYLTPTDYAHTMNAGVGHGGSRVFEMRTYTAAEGKLEALDARFRDHTVALFKKHGITNLGYFHPADADKGSGNTLMYFLAHENRDTAAASWKDFQADPDWVKAKNASEKNGKLTTKVVSVFLTPTDFSPVK